ncbi:hypothetical protein [Geminisphaera colitermitum]|uniref:hypothetical protein n=1 Tax=Geminisphaera colitermitum TaxID=1148786 RepID=UPI000158CA7B|nr:hypothetical protein [Geminisphaera colitermitum]
MADTATSASSGSGDWFSQLFTGITTLATGYLGAKTAKEQAKASATDAKAAAEAVKTSGQSTPATGGGLSTGGIIALVCAGLAAIGGLFLILFLRGRD